MRTILPIAVAVFAFANATHADIFQWEYINPDDPSQGKQQSTTLAPDGARANAIPGAYLSYLDLTMAYLIGADLTGAFAEYANLTNADLTEANLTNADFKVATLTNADFTGADVRGAYLRGIGFTAAQLYATASYQTHDLTGIGLGGDLSGWNFAGQNLTNALLGPSLTSANFTDAEVRGATLIGITLAQLYSTVSHRTHDLTGIRLFGGDLSGGNLAGQILTNAVFGTPMTDADFTGAVVRGARFDNSDLYGGTGITLSQLYSTASYEAHDLTAIDLSENELSGGNFAGQNLTNARFYNATLTGADFREANLANTYFFGANLTDANFVGQHLANTDFQQASLTGALLSQSDLTNANFVLAKLTSADFTGADVRGANFGYAGITFAQLYSTASYQAHDLTGIKLWGHNLTGWNFAGQDLTNADFSGTELTGADFSGADMRGAYLAGSTSNGFTAAQLYSTASYQAHDLTGIYLANNLSGWNFAGQNLTNANLSLANMTGVDFSEANLAKAALEGSNLAGAKLRNANLANVSFAYFEVEGSFFRFATFFGADLTAADARGAFSFNASRDISYAKRINMIQPDGHIDGLNLDAGGLLIVRDYDGDPTRQFNGIPAPLAPISITVDQHLVMGPGGTLHMVFEADTWDSTISFAPGISVTLGGALELTFAEDVNLASQVGRTFDLFNWIGVTPTGAFAISSPYAWDLSNLYTTGQVTLTAVPEPAALALFLLAAAVAFWRRLRRRFRVASQSGWIGKPISGSETPPTRFFLPIAAAVLPLIAFAASAQADIYQWEYINPADPSQGMRQSRTLCADGAGVDAVPGADLSHRDLFRAYLIGADLSNATLSRANLQYADLSNASLFAANLGLADMGLATFKRTNLANANLIDARFTVPWGDCGFDCIRLVPATFTDADLTAADARGSDLFAAYTAEAITVNLIRVDGHVDGLDLDAGGRLVVRKYDGDSPYFPHFSYAGLPIITIDEYMAMDPGGTLQMVFEADAWDSTISFAPGIPVALGGTLELTFTNVDGSGTDTSVTSPVVYRFERSQA